MIFGILAVLIAPDVGKELPERELTGDLVMLYSCALGVELLFVEFWKLPRNAYITIESQAAVLLGDLLLDSIQCLASGLGVM